jgi:acyl phosphate:glycerol-3-phosphate acyltransferase
MTVQDGFILLGAYLLGAIPFGYLITRARTGSDIRKLGSGNIGATNVTRTQGKAWGILTLLLDAGKSAAAVLLCAHLSNQPWMGAAGGAASVVGHCYPVYIGFRGGKGVASGLGAFLCIAPPAALAALGTFILTLLVGRKVSLASIAGAVGCVAALFVLHIRFGRYAQPVPWIGLGIALLLIARHTENVRRLLSRTEPDLWGGGVRP